MVTTLLKNRIGDLMDEARPGRLRTFDYDQVAAMIERTLRSVPADATHWSMRSLVSATGFSRTTIRRMWIAFTLQPHRFQTFKLPSDPLFVDKVCDIVRLYLSAPYGNRQVFYSSRKCRNILHFRGGSLATFCNHLFEILARNLH